MDYTTEEVNRLLQTGIELSKEKDKNRVLTKILDASMEIANCDAGTLYICKDNMLYFKVMRTISQNIDRGRNNEEIDLPPVPMSDENICAYTVLNKKPLNIADVYKCSDMDFSGPRRYDQMTGYHTQSMMTIPLMDQEDQAVGVMQLINAVDKKTGKVIPFSIRHEGIILALASQAAIAMTNICFFEEINEQMWSFTEALAETIDARTPYNANHIRLVADYSCMIADRINELHAQGLEEEYFSHYRREQLRLSALLHDIGKVAIPTSVMNKATRLEHRLYDIRNRFQLFRVKYELQFLKNKITQEYYGQEIAMLDRTENLVEKVNKSGYLSQNIKDDLQKVINKCYDDGIEKTPYFTDEEKECLSIQFGTLTDKEREIMESHVELTERILDKVHFNHHYEKAKLWAAQHHERLDGSGYPRHLTAEQLPLESRILAVADICDALIATDRPYRKPIPRDRAFIILYDMADQGKLDRKLIDYLKDYLYKRDDE